MEMKKYMGGIIFKLIINTIHVMVFPGVTCEILVCWGYMYIECIFKFSFYEIQNQTRRLIN